MILLNVIKKRNGLSANIRGENIGILGLHKGRYYYWPCSAANPEFSGIIDDEEFTAYLYPTEPELWEIVLDPTGMAHRTIYKGIGAFSHENYDLLMEQVHNMRIEDRTNKEPS